MRIKSGKVHLLAKPSDTGEYTLCGVDPRRVRISYLVSINEPERVTCPECLEANAPKVELMHGTIRRGGMVYPTIWCGKYYCVSATKGGAYWSGIGSTAYAQMSYSILNVDAQHLVTIRGRQTKAEVNDFVRWAMVFDALEPQRLAEEAEEKERKQRLWDAQQKQAEKAELLRRNGPRMVKLLRDVYVEFKNRRLYPRPICPGIEALFKDIGEDVEAVTTALARLDREYEKESHT